LKPERVKEYIASDRRGRQRWSMSFNLALLLSGVAGNGRLENGYGHVSAFRLCKICTVGWCYWPLRLTLPLGLSAWIAVSLGMDVKDRSHSEATNCENNDTDSPFPCMVV